MALRQITRVHQPVIAYASLDLAAEDLQARGLKLQDGEIDGLGPTKEAVLLLPSGIEVGLMSFTLTPENGVYVHAPVSVDGPDVAHELVAELGVSPARITWLREEGMDRSQFGSPPDPAIPS